MQPWKKTDKMEQFSTYKPLIYLLQMELLYVGVLSDVTIDNPNLMGPYFDVK